MRFFCLAFLFISSALFAEIPDLHDELEHQFKVKMIEDYPFLLAKDIQVTFLEKSFFQSISPKVMSYRFDIPDESNVLGRTQLPIVFFDQLGDKLYSRSVFTEVMAVRSYFRTNKRIRRSKKITRDDVEEVRLSMQGQLLTELMDMEDVVGKEASVAMAKNTLVTHRMIRSVPVVRQGNIVVALLTGKGFELRSKVKALDDGDVGDVVRVQGDLRSSKIIKGEVLDSNTVRVLFVD